MMCMNCGTNSKFEWKCKGNDFALAGIWETIRPKRPRSSIAALIWTAAVKKAGKML